MRNSGLTISAGIASWVEFHLLRRTLNRRIGRTGLPADFLAKLWTTSLVAAAAGWAIHRYDGRHGPILIALLVLGPYGIIYFAGTWILGIAEARELFGRFLRPLRIAK